MKIIISAEQCTPCLEKSLLVKITIPELLKKYILQIQRRSLLKLLTNARIAEKLVIEKISVLKVRDLKRLITPIPINLSQKIIVKQWGSALMIKRMRLL